MGEIGEVICEDESGGVVDPDVEIGEAVKTGDATAENMLLALLVVRSLSDMLGILLSSWTRNSSSSILRSGRPLSRLSVCCSSRS